MLDYRPISLLTSFSKVLEQIMQTRLKSHLTKYNIFISEQYGFKKNLTIENATCTLTNKILTAMSNKSIAGGIFCDIE
jgi:adenosine deaminase